MRPAISIIVPVYKAESYINRCINSIVSQTFINWELILVDDGSPDNSGKICDNRAKIDRRIKVLHKKNGGVSSARELGIKNANGLYSLHIDPDDWIDNNMLEILYNEAINNNADMTICDFMLEYKDRQERSIQEPKELKSEVYLKQLLLQERHGSLCNKLIKSNLYTILNLHFPDEMTCWEDLYICCSILAKDCKISYVSKPLYHYDLYSNYNSMVRKPNIKTLNSQIKFCHLIERRLKPNQIYLLNETKGICKVTAFRYNLTDASIIRDIFSEINDWYIKKYNKDYSKLYYWGLSQVLRGKTINFTKFMMKFINIYNKANNIINKLLK